MGQVNRSIRFAGIFLPASLFLATQTLPGSALERCSAETRSIEAISAAIENSPNCQASFRIMEECLFGASGDVPLASAVVKKCEADFLPKLNVRQKRAYRRALQACAAKYAGMDGTLYMSMAATCQAATALRFSQKRVH